MQDSSVSVLNGEVKKAIRILYFKNSIFLGYANMEGKGNISDYRKKLDKTLASPDLTNDETVHTLVKNQLLQSPDSQLRECSDYVVKKRSKEVSHFLTELRSASVNDERSKSGDDSHRAWKVKQDSDELRVMYREGPEGTPFHTLLAEGFVDGPVDVCLCISSESDLYKHWWPQATIPTFRVLTSYRAQKVRMGEQISLVRMKLSWPMSSREALVHYFTFEYFQDGLIVVLLKSIPDAENVDISTHGFSRDGIPNAQDVVRIDLLGGFAIQKVTENRSYFSITSCECFIAEQALLIYERSICWVGFPNMWRAQINSGPTSHSSPPSSHSGPSSLGSRNRLCVFG